MTSLKAVFFDFDQTLVDSSQCQLEAGCRSFRQWNMDFVAARKLTGSFPGRRMSEVLALRRDALGQTEEEIPVEELMAARIHHYLEIIPTHVQLMAGARTAIEAAAGLGALVAVVSSEVTVCIQSVLQQYNLQDFISYIIGNDDVNIGKPFPTCYELAYSRLQEFRVATKLECLAVEDSVAGATAAQAAGIPLCFVPDMSVTAKGLIMPYYHLTSLIEFSKLIKRLV